MTAEVSDGVRSAPFAKSTHRERVADVTERQQECPEARKLLKQGPSITLHGGQKEAVHTCSELHPAPAEE